MNIRVILFGVTGMVGEGVLHECLQHPDVESVLVIGRRSCQVQHPKLQELLHNDFFDYTLIENRLKGYNACFFCLGVSSLGMKEQEYSRITYDLTMQAANYLSKTQSGYDLLLRIWSRNRQYGTGTSQLGQSERKNGK